MKDYYSILGLAFSASLQDIKRAFRELAKKYHPDISRDPSSARQFIRITEAYEALIDPEKKKEYDVLYSQILWRKNTATQYAYKESAWKAYGAQKAHEYAAMPYDEFSRRVSDEAKVALGYIPNLIFIFLCAVGMISGFFIDIRLSLFTMLFFGVPCYFLYQRMKSDYVAERKQKISNKYKK